ncbi:MAG TPA: pyridoxal phosphate-dependent aminotransferase family protein, partial [Patescibacteria group bacterium]
MTDPIELFVDQFSQMGLYPDFHTIEGGVNEPVCKVNGEDYLMFCSNNYLGMTQHPAVKEAAKQAIDKYGVGPGGSRVISGNIDIIEDLEKAIAELTGTEDCLTFPTGYMANAAVFRAVMDPLFNNMPVLAENSVIFSDEYNHGSIVDGCRLSKAKKVVFKHDDLADLEQKIKENDLPNKLIVTESVFSLDGEIINIPAYVELAKRTGCKLMVDDAHGIGVLGKHGGGVTEH